MLLMAWNVVMTVRQGQPQSALIPLAVPSAVA
jgi:hypothetical protein